MPKLGKNYYYTRNGEKGLNCYTANIPKKVVEQTNIKDDDNIKIYATNNKIIIEKEN